MRTPAPDPYAPPLTRWGRAWRLLVCATVSLTVWAGVVDEEAAHHEWLFWVDLAFGVVSFVVVLRRRRHPLGIALLLACFSAVSASASGPAALALVSLATRRNLPQLVGVGAVSVASGAALDALAPTPANGPWWLSLLFSAVLTVALIVLGMYVGSRRELMWNLRERAAQNDQQQELRVRQAQSLERERIAREMHDVLAHRISLIAMHAGALAYRTDLPPEQVRETAALISGSAHDALVELREVLGVLRDDEPTHPQPTMGELGTLVAEAVGSGMQVRLRVVVPDGTTVPDRIGRTVYRVVQEALTNAGKHAAGAPVDVEVTGEVGKGVRVSVRNGLAGATGRAGAGSAPSATADAGAGLGLVGMRERVELAGGRLDVRRDGETFGLEGWLPWTA